MIKKIYFGINENGLIDVFDKLPEWDGERWCGNPVFLNAPSALCDRFLRTLFWRAGDLYEIEFQTRVIDRK